MKQNTRTLLSTLWIFLSLNYILCDLISNMESSVLKDLLKGSIAGMELNEGMLLIVAISLEIPIAMVLLSRILPSQINRYTNMVAAILMIVYQIGSFSMGSGNTMHYIFFSIIEIAGNGLIFIIALKARKAITSDTNPAEAYV